MGWGWRGRGGGWAGPWPGRGLFSYLPPWQRPAWLFGFGRAFGRGFGRWWRGYPYNTWVRARFPWLPRWWWAYPGHGYGLPYMAYWRPYMMHPWSMYGAPGYGYRYSVYPWYSPAPYGY